MPGHLVLCSTPIGNLGDTTARLAEALAGADLVYAEDTRRARTLLDHLGVDVPLRSYFVGNEAARAVELADRLGAGATIALVTDAGTPAVADPGVSAVTAARSVGAEVTVVPGPSAVTAALAVSGLGADRFTFEGFLPRRGRARAEAIDSVAASDRTVVFFTTGQRIVADLADLAARSNHDREVVVCREITKLHEEVWAGTLGVAAPHWAGAVRKGEFTVVVAAAAPPAPTGSLDDAEAEARRRLDAGERPTVVAKEVSRAFGVDRGALYDRLASSPTQE